MVIISFDADALYSIAWCYHFYLDFMLSQIFFAAFTAFIPLNHPPSSTVPAIFCFLLLLCFFFYHCVDCWVYYNRLIHSHIRTSARTQRSYQMWYKVYAVHMLLLVADDALMANFHGLRIPCPCPLDVFRQYLDHKKHDNFPHTLARLNKRPVNSPVMSKLISFCDEVHNWPIYFY